MYVLIMITVLLNGGIHVDTLSLSSQRQQCLNDLKRLTTMVNEDEKNGNIIGVDKISAKCEYVKINKESFN